MRAAAVPVAFIALHAARLGAPLRVAVLALILQGCAGYHVKVSDSIDAMRMGAPDAALAALEEANPGKDKDLLYFLEKGELLRQRGDYAASVAAWHAADQRVRAWEEQARTDPGKLLGNLGSVLVNDATRRYDGRDYEKVLLSVRLALNHLALGDWSAARVEITRMHEREALIAEFRDREVDAARETAERKGLRATSFKEINGYPIETLELPEVIALRNAYESALGHYLAGFIYEALGEGSLAAAGYRKAIELRPDAPLLEAALEGLDRRVAAQKRGNAVKPGETALVDTLILVESGMAPAITTRVIPIPLPVTRRNHLTEWVLTPVSWPVVESASLFEPFYSLSVNGRVQEMTALTSVDAMARRALRDEMPGIIARSSVRALVKAAAQKAVNDNANPNSVGGALLSLATMITAFATEQADERAWRTLPAHFAIARVALPPGEHRIALAGAGPAPEQRVQLGGRHALVVLRASGAALYVAQTPPTVGAPASPASPAPTANVRPEIAL